MNELLKTLPEILNFNDVREQPHAFISEDGDLLISGEYGDGVMDYYGEYRGDGPYIHPELVEWAVKNDGYWEWVHPGAISFVR